MSEQPLIIGIRHHSPACAALVRESILAVRPRYVLIEGPADFNSRIESLFLPHQLPVAIYSYSQSTNDTPPGRGAWTPFAEFSPEWQALMAAKEIGAQTRFIDLPAWAQTENDDDDSQIRQRADRQRLLQASGMENSDTLWDHLFEDETQRTTLASALEHYFFRLRDGEPGGENSRQREAYMVRWLAWAMQQNDGPVVAVCGGWHAPALAATWRDCPSQVQEPALQQPSADIVTGCYLTPYSEKRLDVLSGYLSGMPAPVWQGWCWRFGLQHAGEKLLQAILGNLRQRRLPASTADLAAAHLRAMALAQLRGHRLPLRSDWLDALAGALLKEALDTPLPWSYRGVIRPNTDPLLLTIIDTLAGSGFGQLASGTPQPPLPQDVSRELARLAIPLPGQLHLDRYENNGLAQSQVLHRLAILRIPGIQRQQGNATSLSGDGAEIWSLAHPLEQHAALIESARYGATLMEAARHYLEAEMLEAVGIRRLAECLNQAALAGLSAFSHQLLAQLAQLIAEESRFAEMGPALEILYALWRLDDASGMQGSAVLQTTLSAALDRALWLCETRCQPDEAQFHAHLYSWQTLCHILRDLRCVNALSGLTSDAALALLQRRLAAVDAAPVDRGAALGALIRLEHPSANAQTALELLAQLPAQRLGETLHGMLALARHHLASQPTFIVGFSALLAQLAEEEFILALPDLRAAMAWLPPRERGALAQQVLAHYHLTALPAQALQTLSSSPEVIARHHQQEQQARETLAHWGIY
ncbi:DUF5682 family protein [Klebsiella aerogenes]|uniref:DUF5682 family protein n=1 Tax=Klebsiella aerogenes TaxID=548 RepID=UPI0034D37856